MEVTVIRSCLVLVSVLAPFVQAADIGEWNRRLDRGLSAAFEDQTLYWPRISLYSADGRLTTPPNSQYLLLDRLRAQLQSEAHVVFAKGIDSRYSWAMSILAIARRLEVSSGYPNIVVAQGMRRAALDTIFYCVKQGAVPSALLVQLLATPTWTNELLDSLIEETGMRDLDRKSITSEIDPELRIVIFARALQKSQNSSRSTLLVPVTEMLKKRDVQGLLIEMQISETASRMFLYAYCLGIQNGGDRLKLLSDSGEFTRVFGSEDIKLPHRLWGATAIHSSIFRLSLETMFPPNQPCDSMFCKTAFE